MEIKIKESENIKTIFYFESTEELWVFFNSNSTYVYNNVPKNVVKKLKTSKEQGKFFYDNIREKFNFRKIV